MSGITTAGDGVELWLGVRHNLSTNDTPSFLQHASLISIQQQADKSMSLHPRTKSNASSTYSRPTLDVSYL